MLTLGLKGLRAMRIWSGAAILSGNNSGEGRGVLKILLKPETWKRGKGGGSSRNVSLH